MTMDATNNQVLEGVFLEVTDSSDLDAIITTVSDEEGKADIGFFDRDDRDSLSEHQEKSKSFVV